MPPAPRAAAGRRAKVWKVAGADLLVREGQGLRSPELPGRLAAGAVVKQVSIAGGRICYKLLTGTGPESGWVSLEVKGRETLCDAGWMTEEMPATEAKAEPDKEKVDAYAAAKELLDIAPDATQDDINSAFRKASVKVHPDRCPDDPLAATKFQELTGARDLLLSRCPDDEANTNTGAKPGAKPAECHGSLPSAQISGQIWEVIDSNDPQGLVVREERSLSSQQLSDHLVIGAVVEELQRDGDRVRYRKLKGEGPELGWISIRSKGKELLRAPGLTLDPLKALGYHMKGHSPDLAVLSMDQALRLLDDLLAAFSRSAFQARLRKKWEECRYDPDKFGVARFPLVLGVQGPIVSKYGFENSPKGIMDSVIAYWAGEAPLNAYPEVAFKNDMMHYLTDPGKQMLIPIGNEDFPTDFCKRLTEVRMAGHYDLVYPFPKPWDARPLLIERGILAADAPSDEAAAATGVGESPVPEAEVQSSQ